LENAECVVVPIPLHPDALEKFNFLSAPIMLNLSTLPASRRDFLKVAGMGTAGATLGPLAFSPMAGTNVWTPGTAINPNISNLRVVCCYDPAMVSQTPTNWSVATQNTAVNKIVIAANMDVMAKSLTQKATAAEAWAAIFMKPAAKGWPQVKVAIKVPVLVTTNCPRVAIMDKLCRELNALGVPFSSITIYDGASNAQPVYNSFVGSALPAGVIVSSNNSALGGTVNVQVAALGSFTCTANIASGSVDILINIATNRGHNPEFGNCTLTLKNHYGTFAPADHSSVNYLLALSQNDAILGGTPPRQQLCIVDSLWASVAGPANNPDQTTARLVMGTFSPVVDYLTIKKIREQVMSATHNAAVVDRFATDFGYTTTDYATAVFVDVPPASAAPLPKPSRPTGLSANPA
jgi:hypothetical protein